MLNEHRMGPMYTRRAVRQVGSARVGALHYNTIPAICRISNLSTAQAQMPPHAEAASPVYLTYIYKTPTPGAFFLPNSSPAHTPHEHMRQEGAARQQAAGASERSVTRTSKEKPYHPLSQSSEAQLEIQSSQNLYANFHVPWNQHNRFLTAATAANQAAYRPIERAPPPPFGNPGRPSSAPHSRPAPQYTEAETQRIAAGVHHLSAGSLSNSLVTATGAPSFSVPALVEADIEEGKPLHGEHIQPWRVTRVEAYVVAPHPLGFGPGGAKPFHQDYRHYKYFGFAGKGAKTSWGHNPKEGIINAHTYAGRGSAFRKPATGHPPRYLDKAELVDPHIEVVDIITRQRLSQEQQQQASQEQVPAFSSRTNPARVMTYRAPEEWHYTLTENPSPQAGSQSAFHQRYSHYKHFGFAGKGATSSWARNPKYAFL